MTNEQIQFRTSRSTDTLAISVAIAVPAAKSDWKLFMSEAKKCAIKNEFKLSDTMSIIFKRGNDPKLQAKFGKRTYIYDDVYEGIAECLGYVDEDNEPIVSALFTDVEEGEDEDEQTEDADSATPGNSAEATASFTVK